MFKKIGAFFSEKNKQEDIILLEEGKQPALTPKQ
jgi:hypothetical protein